MFVFINKLLKSKNHQGD